MEMMVWNVVLSTLLAVVGWVLKEKSSELQRLQVLLNKTREEVARENVTQAELDKIVSHIDGRFDKLTDKLDVIIREQRSAIN